MAPSGLYARLCHAFLVSYVLNADRPIVDVRSMPQLVTSACSSVPFHLLSFSFLSSFLFKMCQVENTEAELNP